MKRLLPVLSEDRLRVVCGDQHVDGVARQMQDIGIDPLDKIIAEPCGRNTAPAILLAVLNILKQTSDAICCVFPADHVIGDEVRFQAILASAIQLADKGHIVTFGIQPLYPETGYGYIEGAAKTDQGARLLKRFVEKPDLATAQQYLAVGNYFWNSGMFAFRASVIKAEFENFLPEMTAQLEKLISSGHPISSTAYAELENISIDYAIMEKTTKGVVLPSDFQWSDVGSWKSLYDLLPQDENGNVVKGSVFKQNVRNSMLVSNGRVIAANHLDNVVVVETEDAVFVSDLENSREVKSIVETMQALQCKEIEKHNTVRFAWGRQTQLSAEDDHIVEKLSIDPNAESQMQQSDQTSTCMIVVNGKAKITTSARQTVLEPGAVEKVSEKGLLRIKNCGDGILVILRVVLVDNDKERENIKT